MSEGRGPPDAAAFVVDADEKIRSAEIAEIVGELSGLLGGGDVPGEEDEAARIHLTVESGILGGEFQSGNSENQQLAGR